MIILSNDNPLYNTIIIFTVIMGILFLTKPNLIYCSKTNQFRQFGTSQGKTLLPIYIVGILLAVILYVFFYSIMKKKDHNNFGNNQMDHMMSERYNGYNNPMMNINHPNPNDANINQIYLMQQQQINTLNSQIQQLIQHQLINNSIGIKKNDQLIIPNQWNA